MQTVEKIKRIPDYRERFRELASLYVDFCREEGLKVVPFRSPELTVFSRNSLERQREAVDCLTLYLEVFEEMRAERLSLRDSPKLLWRCLARLGLTPQSDIFDKIRDGHVVEVYTPDQRQIFHNLKFWEYISFTVEEVFGSAWWEMTSRDAGITQRIFELAVQIASGQIRGTVAPGIEEHLFVENLEAGGGRCMIKILYLSPVRAQGQVAGILVVNSCRPA